MYLPRQRLRSRNNIHDHILTVLSCPDRIIQSAHTGGDNYGKAIDGCQTVVPLTKSGQTVQPSDRRDLTAMGMSGQLQVKAQCTILLQIARLMLTEPNMTFSKELLITRAWGMDSEATDNNVEAYISFLRKKLRYLGSRVTIRNLQKIGYRLEVQP